MPIDDYNKHRYSELQQELDNLNEDIEFYRDSERTEDLRPQEKLRLKRQIKQAETKRDSVIQQLQELDKTCNSEQLYRNLLKLGYERQVELFLRAIQTQQSVAAFLIHGSYKHGQRWLLNRLVEQYVPESISGRKIRMDLSRSVGRTDVKALWRDLGARLGKRGQQLPPLELAEGVYRWWQTENVLLIFNDINLMPKDHLEKLIGEFWKPLANKAIKLANQAIKADSGASNYKLLMFLVDYDGSVGNLDHLFAEQVQRNKADVPVKPPSIGKFTQKNVSDWMLHEFSELPRELTHNVDDTVREILSESDQGIPEDVLRGIFDRCGYDYYEEVERLWKL